MSNKINQSELGISDLLKETWPLYCKEIKPIAIVILLGCIPGVFSDYLLAGDPTKMNVVTGLLTFIELLIVPLIYMGISVIVENRITSADTVKMNWRIAVSKASARWGSCIGTTLLAGLILLGLSLLLIIPGVIWSLYYSFVLQVIVLRGLGGKAALDYSKSLVEGRWWSVFVMMFLLGLITSVPSFVLVWLSSHLPHGMITILRMGANIFTMGFQIVGMTILFLNLDYVRKDTLEDRNKGSFRV